MEFRALFLAASLAVGGLSHALPALGEGWSPTGSLAERRIGHTATLLRDGRVLVVGGLNTRGRHLKLLKSAEIFDPATESWSGTAPLSMPRARHTATLLRDGRVLVAGGATTSPTGTTASAEIFDPATATWSPTGSMARERSVHSATELDDGSVLVAGGHDSERIDTAEVYDPARGAWGEAGVLNLPRLLHSATRLQDGTVLVAGGTDDGYLEGPLLGAPELYDPGTRTWRLVSQGLMAGGFHAATLTPGGQVVVTGGYDWPFSILSRVDVFDPRMGTWSRGHLAKPRSSHTATLLPNGEILIAGGGGAGPQVESELLSPETGEARAAGRLTQGRFGHTATLLLDGRVLVVGGSGELEGKVVEWDTAEIYDGESELDRCKNHYILSRPCPAPS